MVAGSDLQTGRDALHRLDALIVRAREDHAMALGAAEGQASRRADLVRLRAEGYRELAKIRLDIVKAGAAKALSEAEARAVRLLDDHDAFIDRLEVAARAAAADVEALEAARLEVEGAVDGALHAYEALVEQTEAAVQTDPAYVALKAAHEDAGAVASRATQKLELARADRAEKGAPYENDPLFAYLWERKFRTTAYRGRGIVRAMDNWVAQVSGYDAAYLNYARLIELPDRLDEHRARMESEQAEAEAAIARFEAAKLDEAGAPALAAAVEAARERLRAADSQLAAAEAKLGDIRSQQEKAASGDVGPLGEAVRLIEDGLAKASFPNLKVLAAETTTPDDDRIVDMLIRLRTEELQLELSARSVDTLPGLRRRSVDALETVRRRFKEAGLDSPFVTIGGAAFEAALEAWGRGPDADADKLWRAMTATVRRAPRQDDDYFGGRSRGRTVGLPPGVETVAGVVLGEIIREVTRGSRGPWDGGGGGPWGGSSGGSSGRSSGGSRGGRIGGGGFKTGGRIGGGGFKTRGRF